MLTWRGIAGTLCSAALAMGRGTRAQPSRGRAKGDDGGGSPVPPQDDAADDGERVRYHVSVPLGMWEVRRVALV
jgi:hypothetical protein